MVQTLEHWLLFQQTWTKFPAPIWCLPFSVTPISGYLTSLSGFQGHCMHSAHIYIQVKNTHTYKIKKLIFKNIQKLNVSEVYKPKTQNQYVSGVDSSWDLCGQMSIATFSSCLMTASSSLSSYSFLCVCMSLSKCSFPCFISTPVILHWDPFQWSHLNKFQFQWPYFQIRWHSEVL